jgi:hypothetical protein
MVVEVKTVTLDDYQDMLNTEPLREEAVPFLSIFFLLYLSRESRSGVLRVQ